MEGWDQPYESKTRLRPNRTFGQNTVRLFHDGKYAKDQATPKASISPQAYRNEIPEEAVESTFPTEKPETTKTDLWLSSPKKGAPQHENEKGKREKHLEKTAGPTRCFTLDPQSGSQLELELELWG